jgi:hypothetical protein
MNGNSSKLDYSPGVNNTHLKSFNNSVGEEGSMITNRNVLLSVKGDAKINHFNLMNTSTPLSHSKILG